MLGSDSVNTQGAGLLLGVLLAIVGVVILIYMLVGILLNKLNKVMYGKGTALAFIPFCNVYLLGKLTINKIVGWVLLGCLFLTGQVTTTVNGVSKTYSLLPENISKTVSTIYGAIEIGLLIYAIVKYNNLKKSGFTQENPYYKEETYVNVNQQPVNNVLAQGTMPTQMQTPVMNSPVTGQTPVEPQVPQTPVMNEPQVTNMVNQTVGSVEPQVPPVVNQTPVTPEQVNNTNNNVQ